MTFDLKQAAEKLLASPRTVATWIKNGELQAFDAARVRGQRPRWRVTQAAIEQFIASRSTIPITTTKRRRRKPADNDVIQFYPE